MFVFTCVCVCLNTEHLYRLRPEPRKELELIRARDLGHWIIPLFRLADLLRYQRRAGQYDRIVVTEKPKACLFISRVQCRDGGTDDDDELTEHNPPYFRCRQNHIPCEIRCVKSLVSPLCLYYLNVQDTLKGQLGVSSPSHVSKITSSGQ